MLGRDVVDAGPARRPRRRRPRARRPRRDGRRGRRTPPSRDAAPDAVVNCAAWTDVDGAEAAEDARHRRQRRRRRQRGRARRRPPARSSSPCPPTTSSTAARASRTSSRSRPRRSAPTGAPSSPASAPSRPPPLPRASGPSCARAGCSARTGRTSSPPCCASRASATSSPWSTTRSAAPPSPAIWRPRCWPSRRARRTGILHVAGSGCCSWWDLARATFEAAGHDVRLHPGPHGGPRAPGAAPRVVRAGRTERADAPVLPAWQDGLAAYLELQGVRA